MPKMSKKEILEFLIQTMEIQMEEEYKTTDHKDYIKKCIEAKQWLLKQLNGKANWLNTLDCLNDADKYLKEDK